jgi:tRNA A37 threonylcarbamoyltransferase TsaD
VFSVVTGQCVSLETLLKTYNIGMTGCLGVGSSAAKTLAAALKKPLVGVHHMVYLLFPCVRSIKIKNSRLRKSKHMP